MKKILITVFLILSDIAVYAGSENAKQNLEKDDSSMIFIGGYDYEDYESENIPPQKGGSSAKVKRESAKKPQINKEDEDISKEKSQSRDDNVKTNKEQLEKKPVRLSLLKGYKRHSLESFEIDLPKKCEIIKEEKDSASIKEDSGCLFKGKIGAFTGKYPTKTLVERYKERCNKENKKTLYKRWLQSLVYEGYVSVCEDEKEITIAMEANSNISDKSYQFMGKAIGRFDQKIKEQIYITFKSLWEK